MVLTSSQRLLYSLFLVFGIVLRYGQCTDGIKGLKPKMDPLILMRKDLKVISEMVREAEKEIAVNHRSTTKPKPLQPRIIRSDIAITEPTGTTTSTDLAQPHTEPALILPMTPEFFKPIREVVNKFLWGDTKSRLHIPWLGARLVNYISFKKDFVDLPAAIVGHDNPGGLAGHFVRFTRAIRQFFHELFV